MTKQLGPRALATRARLLLTALSVLALATPSSCGSGSSRLPDGGVSDGSAGRGGAGGHGGAGVDGGAHDAAGGGSAGGMTGTTDAGIGGAAGNSGAGGAIVDSAVDMMPETCGPGGQGCARLSVPLVDPQTGTFFGIAIPPTDLTDVSAVYRFCLVAGGAQGGGWVQPFAQEGIAPYAGQYDVVAFSAIPACPSFVEYTFNFPGAPDPSSDAGSPWFTRVQNLGLKIQSLDGASGSWANPTVVYVDSVTLSRRAPDGGAVDGAVASNDGGAPDDASAPNDADTSDGGATADGGAPADSDADASGGGGPPPLPGPFTFDTSSFPFSVGTYNEVPGSALDWVP